MGDQYRHVARAVVIAAELLSSRLRPPSPSRYGEYAMRSSMRTQSADHHRETHRLERIELAAPKSRGAVDPTVLIDGVTRALGRNQGSGSRSREDDPNTPTLRATSRSCANPANLVPMR